MNWRYADLDDLELLAGLNRRLQEDEGANPMTLPALRKRLEKWLGSDHRAVIFEHGGDVVAYALFRETDRDSDGAGGGIYIQQFYVERDQRRGGLGRQAFDLLVAEVWPKDCGILLDTIYGNRRAQSFWRSVGFTEHRLSFKRLPASEAKAAERQSA